MSVGLRIRWKFLQHKPRLNTNMVQQLSGKAETWRALGSVSLG